MKTPLSALVFAFLIVGAAYAVQPQRFVHTNEADFEPGEFDGTVVTDLGDLELTTTSKLLAELPAEYTVVYDVVEVEGETFVAVGPEAAVFKLGGEVEADDNAEADEDAGNDENESDDEEESEHPTHELVEFATFPGEQVFKLAAPGGNKLVICLSGTPSRIVVMNTSGDEAGEVETEVEFPDVRYVWDLLITDALDVFVATGPDGVVYRSAGEDADGNPTFEVALDTPQANVLTLAASTEADGNPGFPVYAGTDTDGIIYRLDEDGSTTAVYDAAEPEVAALVVAADGTLYAGTADADQARPGRIDGANEEDTGRPDTDTPSGEILDDPTDPGDMPDDPLPIEPDPAPMQTDQADDAAADAMANEAETAEQADDAAAEAEAAEGEETPDAPSDITADADTGDDALAQGETAEITAEQYDALREEVRKRLETARKTGKLAASAKASSAPKATRPRTAGSPEASAKEGNAVYKISPDGLVTEPFRESVMVLGLHLDEPNHRLLIATGSEGQIYEVKLDPRETAVLEDLDAEQVVTVAEHGDGAFVFGTANPGTLRTLAATTDQTAGTYTSVALDAEQVSLWGKLQLAAQRGTVAGVTVETRSGAVADPDAAAWSPWEPAAALGTDDQGLRLFEVASPPARFIQYRLTLEADGNGAPSIDKVDLAYVRPNLAPRISTFTAAYADTPDDPDEPTPTTVNLEWEAEDPNADRIRYDLQAQPMPTANQPDPGWLTVAEDLEETSYEWDTKTVPDGRYVVRVVGHDRLDNPKGSAKAGSRRSDPLLIDNTPPTLILDPDQDDDAPRGRMIGTARDAHSPVAAVDYRVSADEPWRPALPDDRIYDSTEEAFSFTLPRLAPGGHVLSLRVRDTRGNAAYASRFITVPQ